MAKERADLGFSDALEDFDPADWTPRKPRPPADRPAEAATRKAAAAAGFRSREPQPAPEMEAAAESESAPTGQAGPGQGRGLRRRRTGRTAQLNLKVRPETIQAFYAIADREGWGLGETFEHALAALEAGSSAGGRQK